MQRHSPFLDSPKSGGSPSHNDLVAPPRSTSRISALATPSSSPRPPATPSETPSPQPASFKFPLESLALETTSHSNTESLTSSNPKSGGQISNALVEGADSSIHLAPATRILAGSSINGSNRSSGEFYSVSNGSSETLGSEYPSQLQGSQRLLEPSAHRRNISMSKLAVDPSRPFETLLMGYAQVTASFTLDGSLVNQNPFEEVKRKGIVGGQGGGGVVGVESTKKTNSLFGALGLNNIGESLGGLLNSGGLSSIKEMRNTANSRAIPLLSTPQSLLFVDLRLSPGESRSYRFRFTLPNGLPASHRGKALKITYNLVIGTQRPGSLRDAQHVRRVNFPFRVFSGVNGQGEILGHDLMFPHILLKDQSHIQALDADSALVKKIEDKFPQGKAAKSSVSEFLTYVDNILEQKSRQNSTSGLLSPTETASFPSNHIRPSPKESINLAILRSNQQSGSTRSSNRFEISRNGCRIANVVLDRGSHRLGETVSAIIEFRDADIPCYSLNATLETSEKVNPAIALRSSASINRATRKIYASQSGITLFATRAVFTPTIPVSATPTILTSGVTLEWCLRFEFSTTKVGGEEDLVERVDLLERIANDDRGSVLAAAEALSCETFEVMIPLVVYGEVGEAVPEEALGSAI
jgi:RAB6A-GEF complex partner protein 2